nr:hypothetical protein [Tanacetum cinerariifolium]
MHNTLEEQVKTGHVQIPHRSNENIQLEMAKLIKNNRIFFNNNSFPHEEASMEVLLAKERILKLIQAWDDKQIESWSLPKLLLQLFNDSQTIDEMLKQLNSPVNAIAPVLPTEEPDYSLSMGDEHLSTIQETESDEVIKSSVKNLVPIPSEYEVTFDDENECDVPIKDESSPVFTTFSNPVFDDNDDFTSSDDELHSNEDVLMENFKSYSNPLFDDEEINSNKIDPHYFNAESNLIESLLNRNTLFDSSPKFDYLEDFFGELMPTSIINEERIKREHKEYISFMEKLLTINSFSRPLENFYAYTIVESLSPSPIPVEDSDSQRDEIDLFLIQLLSNDTPPILKNKSSTFDHHDDPSFPRPPLEPPDVEIFFKPDSGVLTTNVVKGISEHYVLMLNIWPTLPTFDPLYPVYDTLLLFSLENKDKVFKPSILSYLLVSHRDQTTSDFFKNQMMMFGGDIPLLDVPYFHFYPARPSLSVGGRVMLKTRLTKISASREATRVIYLIPSG